MFLGNLTFFPAMGVGLLMLILGQTVDSKVDKKSDALFRKIIK